MKEKTDSQKIQYLYDIQKYDKLTLYRKRKAKDYIRTLYSDAIAQHDNASDKYIKGEYTSEECDNVQNNVIKFIKVLKKLNKKHKLLDRLIDWKEI